MKIISLLEVFDFSEHGEKNSKLRITKEENKMRNRKLGKRKGIWLKIYD